MIDSLSEFFKNFFVPIWIADDNFSISFKNDVWVDVLGKGLEVSSYLDLKRFIDEKDWGHFEKNILSLKKGQSEVSDIYHLIDNSGNLIPFKYKISKIKAFGYSKWLCVNTEVSDLIKKNREAEKQNSDYKVFQNIISDGWWEWNLLTGEEYFGPQIEKIFGYSKDDIRKNGGTIQSFLFPEDLELALSAIKDHIDHGIPYSPILRFLHKKGHPVWVIVKGVAIKDESGIHSKMIGTYTDITKIKQAEQKLEKVNQELEVKVEDRTKDLVIVNENLAKRNSQLESIFNVFPDKLFILETDTTILNVELSKDYFEASKVKGFVGKKIGDLYSDEIGEKIQNAIKKTLKEKRMVSIQYHVANHKEVTYFEGRLLPFFGGKIFLLERDVSEQRTLEKELEVQRLNSIQASKLASLGEMAGGIAHEINNPLAIILGFAEKILYLIKKEKLDVAMLHDSTVKIFGGVQRIAGVVKGLKNFARDGSGDKKEMVLVKDLLDETLAFCRERFYSNNVDLKIMPFDPSLKFPCRRLEISQVFINILNNGFDAVKKLKDKWVRIEVADSGDMLNFYFIDSGNGIPIEVQERMSNPFFTTKPIGEGMGMGLSVSKGIIEKHNGKMFVDNDCNNTKFVIRFPKSMVGL